MALRISASGAGVGVGMVDGPGVFTVSAPVCWESLAGQAGGVGYDTLDTVSGGLICSARLELGQGRVEVRDRWIAEGHHVLLQRSVRTLSGGHPPLRFDLDLELSGGAEDRYLVPGMISSAAQLALPGRQTFADDRLGYPAVAVWQRDPGRVVWITRRTVARMDAPPVRQPGESRFVRDTEIGCVGFRAGTRSCLTVGWPMAERERSSQLDAAGTPVVTYHSGSLDFQAEYEIGVATASDFATAVATATRQFVRIAAPSATELPVPFGEAIDLRLDSAAKTYVETASGMAGFVLNFDPEGGYQSQARAFGASFADHAMGGSHEILEYGFTGRQLSLAYLLARRSPQAWAERGYRVVQSYVDRLATPGGWMGTLFDLAADEPVYAVGDPRGPVMHYLGRSELRGTYTRMMCEAGSDLVANIGLHSTLGAETGPWLLAARRLADFLVRAQNRDGSWYRAYAVDGMPIVGDDWFGDPERSGKSATAAVIPYLLQVSALVGGDEDLRAAAARAGHFVLQNVVAPGEFRGGTLDNPNLVDKEACFLAMRAMVALEDSGIPGSWRGSAVSAAWFALGWHSLWEVPNLPGTRVGEACVRSVGWGGINSVWGVGVTDIYSLFFAGTLHRLGAREGVPEFLLVAELIAAASLQLLSVPGDLHGFADTGMQPEGIAFCDQGRDEGLIRKGDSWGGLGWPYTAGTAGLLDFLSAREEEPAR